MNVTEEERTLLVKLAEGLLDGLVGNEREYRKYKKVYCGKLIKNGMPISYRQGKRTRSFTGEENEFISGKREEEWFDTVERKLQFLQKYGWLINDEDAKKYSAKYKQKK